MKVRATRRDDIEFEIDERFEYLLETCSFWYDKGYIGTYCNSYNEELLNKYGYRRTQKIFLHRLLYQLHIGRKLESYELVDHINRDKLNNKIENLRILSSSQNTKNRKLKDDQIYHNICYDKYSNYFKFRHQEAKVGRNFRSLHQALEFFRQYDEENDHVLTKSIHNLKPIDEIEDIVLEADAFCERCGATFWCQHNLNQHQKKCAE